MKTAELETGTLCTKTGVCAQCKWIIARNYLVFDDCAKALMFIVLILAVSVIINTDNILPLLTVTDTGNIL